LTTVLEAENVTKTYQLGQIPVRALRGATFKVEKGEYVAVLGPSGSGKSTLLNMIGALDRPSSGRLEIEGVDVSTLSNNELSDLRQNVGFVFQFFNLIPRLDALGNVELPLSIAGVPRDERKKRAAEMLERVGLGDRMDHKPSELSGGERQRVAVARALVTNPAFLLMDEPTGNLDSKTAAEMMEMVKQLNEEQGVTLVVVTHDRGIGNQASRTLQMLDGVVASDEVN
jgi:putative ABC transport system ATP-binding protein